MNGRWPRVLRWALIGELYAGGGGFATASISHPALVLEGKGLIPIIGWNLPALAVLVVVVGAGWAATPVFLKRALLATFVPLFTLQFFFGILAELRDLRETVPIVALLAYAGLERIWRIDRGAPA